MKLYFSRTEQIIVAVLILIIVGGGVAFMYNNSKPAVATYMPPKPVIAEKEEPVASKVVPERADILIHITGEVRKPGVYKMKDGDRIQDAIMMAGGAKKNADPDQLNLVSKLIDGEKIIVPGKLGTEQPVVASKQPLVIYDTPASKKNMTSGDPGNVSLSTASSNEKVIDASRPVNINKATEEELANRLPGVGPGTAKKIVDYRTQNGPFKDLSELVNVPGLGPKTVEKITPYITL
ncbi:MAG: helix-hairpin-helix domain-containing protein [bacterium]